MHVQVQKWGNSLALRIPKTYAKETNVRQGSAVELTLVEGKLVVTPIEKSSYKLKNLMAHVHKDNIHGEQDFGPKVGSEIW